MNLKRAHLADSLPFEIASREGQEQWRQIERERERERERQGERTREAANGREEEGPSAGIHGGAL